MMSVFTFDDAVNRRWPGFSCAACDCRAAKVAPVDCVDGYLLLLAEVFGRGAN